MNETNRAIVSISPLLMEESFQPPEPRMLEETGLSELFVEGLICKHLAVVGNARGRAIAEHLCLPLGILEERFQKLRTQQLLTHRGAGALHDFIYALSEQGLEYARLMHEASAYRGPAPVPLADYIAAVEAQTIRAESPRHEQLQKAFDDISVEQGLFSKLGPAVNSGAGLFLYGAPGNGKTTLAERLTLCFGRGIWIPRTLIADGEIIKLYDPAYHHVLDSDNQELLRDDFHDRRWIKIVRPTVIVGGELTMDNLEIQYDARTNIGEAPLQLKSNCGTLLIDDFGRQRINHFQLLNRWIVPLEKRYDYLTLGSGKKIQVPFDQLIIFSTNLEPKDLVDEAFLRRIPYKINVPDPNEEEFHRLFKMYARQTACDYDADAVEYLIDVHYRRTQRRMRRCHPRDLLLQIHNYCAYNGLPMEMTKDYFDLAVENYFTMAELTEPRTMAAGTLPTP